MIGACLRATGELCLESLFTFDLKFCKSMPGSIPNWVSSLGRIERSVLKLSCFAIRSGAMTAGDPRVVLVHVSAVSSSSRSDGSERFCPIPEIEFFGKTETCGVVETFWTLLGVVTDRGGHEVEGGLGCCEVVLIILFMGNPVRNALASELVGKGGVGFVLVSG